MDYQIIKGETPPRPTTVKSYPFAELGVGDCFEAPADKRGSLSCLASAYGRKLNRKFGLRNAGDGKIRVWRFA